MRWRKSGAGFAATLAVVAALGGAPVASADPGPVPSEPCYNGVFPLNPNVPICNSQPRPPRVLGSAPDASALINCGKGPFRAQCLSLYVNGGYGWYPGAVLVPGYHP